MDQVILKQLRSYRTGTRYSKELAASLTYLYRHFDEIIGLDDLTRVARVSRQKLCRIFTEEFGLTPIRWLWRFRVVLAGEMIRFYGYDVPLTEIALSCGYTDCAHFSRSFQQFWGVSPSRYRAQIWGHKQLRQHRTLWEFSEDFRQQLTCPTSDLLLATCKNLSRVMGSRPIRAQRYVGSMY